MNSRVMTQLRELKLEGMLGPSKRSTDASKRRRRPKGRKPIPSTHKLSYCYLYHLDGVYGHFINQ